MRKPIAISFILLLGLACNRLSVVPNSQSGQFNLSMLQHAQVAIWPVAIADLDADASRAVGKAYVSRDQFMDAFSADFSHQLLGFTQAGSIDSPKVQAALESDDSHKALLDPNQLLGVQDSSNRFETPAPNGLAALPGLAFLKGVKYAIVPMGLAMGTASFASQDQTWVSHGRQGSTFVTSPTTSSNPNARLRLAVIDIDTRQVVWDGAIFYNFYDSPGSLAKALATGFENRALGIN